MKPSNRTLNNLLLKEVSPEELGAILEQHFEKVFSNRSEVSSDWEIQEDAKAMIRERKMKEQRYRLRLVAYAGEKVIGWHYGYSTDAETYYMQNSAILPEYRKRGGYSQLLDGVLEIVGKQGFQVVTSIHHPNNAAVLIPKLKKGFIVSGMQIHEKFRFLIELKFFFNEKRRKTFGKTLGLDIDSLS